MKVFGFDDVTRIVVVPADPYKVAYEVWDAFDGCEIHLQDDGRTLKIFPLVPSGGD